MLQGENKSKPTFPTGILHHQNNSFDEFHECGYARAHCEDGCSETNEERRELCAFSSTLIPKDPGKLAPKQFRLAKQPAGSKKAAGRRMQFSILCDSDSLS
jgi:hypothetical protein